MSTDERSSAPQSVAERWTELARAVAEATRQGPPASTEAKGKLVVLGSGIAHNDFTADAEAEIVSADYVFHCTYDPVSKIWLHSLRPDAFDLSVLYSESIDRYLTYVRMAESLLYHVRRGKKVVAIYYGHPGIFATPAHRAIKIAREEGHWAQMRPGISALDYLVADLGFDPALPGLISYEATDLLLRRRHIDTGLHFVLWQVGVVGEFGFAPGGFENKGFDLLVDELAAAYGEDWQVTHYIAAQYVGIPPLIERRRIADLRTAKGRRRINSLSTFYIEPQAAAPTDPERAVQLGLSKPGEPAPPPSRLYDTSRYDEPELAALRAFDQFAVSASFRLPQTSPGAEFMFALSRDLDLQDLYRSDPAKALEDPRFAHLSERMKKLLAIPHPWAFATALTEGESQSN